MTLKEVYPGIMLRRSERNRINLKSPSSESKERSKATMSPKPTSGKEKLETAQPPITLQGTRRIKHSNPYVTKDIRKGESMEIEVASTSRNNNFDCLYEFVFLFAVFAFVLLLIYIRSQLISCILLEQKMRQQNTDMTLKEISRMKDRFQEILNDVSEQKRTQMTKMMVQEIKNELKKWEEDNVQVKDYALYSLGATIIKDKTSQSLKSDNLHWSFLGILSWPYTSCPEEILKPDVYPGKCWTFPGSQGQVLIKLSAKIIPVAVTLQHISKTISPSKNYSSAPRDFSVFGYEHEFQETGKILGQFTYNPWEALIQSFKLMNDDTSRFQFIQLRILSNWGNEKYTSVYRFQVHQELPVQLRS
eukprot:XP_012815662.2 PREDICTED: SUN domain-containing protein 3 [Xenopus tropicalis]